MTSDKSQFAYCCAGCGVAIAALTESHAAGSRRRCVRCAPSDADILPLLLHGFIGRLAPRVAMDRTDAAFTDALASHLTGEGAGERKDRGCAVQCGVARKVSSG